MLWDKGVGTLIEASRLLRRKHPVRIIFVGEPDPGNPASVPEATIQQWVKEGLVEWWGFCRNMASVYQSGHIVTLPSLGEGLPTALIEASACARPIVTTDVPGCRDIVTDGVNGFLVPPNQPDALAEALERLYLDKPLRERMGAAGREIVLDRFTTTLVNQKTMDVYRSVLDQYQRVVPAQ
jgi:glycosyltransferase involved in cell wall biosynthesis